MPTKLTQEQRSQTMRQRLIKAALDCLANDGYAKTSVSSILEQAKVSRGALLHHYPNKNDLLRDAAAELMRLAYRKLGASAQKVEPLANRLEVLLLEAWGDVFLTNLNKAFVELLLAARSEPELAAALHPLAINYVRTLRAAGEHYFVSSGNLSVGDAMMLTQWLFRGMALDASLPENTSYFDHLCGFG